MTDKAKRSELQGYISTQEASQMLGITRRRVQQLCKSGKLEAVWFAYRWLVKPSAVEAYRQERQ